MKKDHKALLLDCVVLLALSTLLFLGGLATLGCGPDSVPGAGLKPGQPGVATHEEGGIVFDVTDTDHNSALYRVERFYENPEDGETQEYTWTPRNAQDADVLGPDPEDPSKILVRIYKDESRARRSVVLTTQTEHFGERHTSVPVRLGIP